MPNLTRHVFFRLPPSLSMTRGGRRRKLMRAAAMVAAPVATQQVISAFAQQNTPIDLVSIGNEIRNGILWPVGQVDPSTGTGYDNLATLLKAGVAGARAGNPPGHKLL